MEVVYTRRYKINIVFSLIVSFSAASISALLFPYVFTGFENLKGIAAASVFIILHLFITGKYRKRKRTVLVPFPDEWRQILYDKVLFYKMLGEEEKFVFEKKIQIFLSEKIITGVGTEIDDTVRLLVASAAVIPVFRIDDWEYDKLGEILVYPDRFDNEYNYRSGDRDVLGMVVQNSSSLIISKKELLRGFSSEREGNTAIHEFIHIIDESDGEIDGLPVLMLSGKDIAEYRRIRAEEIKKLEAGGSDLDSYAMEGEAEFLAVAGEYFFKHPEKMKMKSPELYNILKKIFRQDTAGMLKSEAAQLLKRKTVHR